MVVDKNLFINEINALDGENIDQYKDEIPSNWEVFGNSVILPKCSFVSSFWKGYLNDSFWVSICQKLKVDKIFRRDGPILNDMFRSPQITIIYGSDGWVFRKDDGIKIYLDVTKCMFSTANINEKLRISKKNCYGKVVVDFYAGIGYFTLPFIIKTQAQHVYSIDWNPNSIEALKRNLLANKVSDKCTVIFGDCTQLAPKNVADIINMGLIPHIDDHIYYSIMSLKETGGYIFFHILYNENEMIQKETNEGILKWKLTIEESCTNAQISKLWYEKTTKLFLQACSERWVNGGNIFIKESFKIKSYAPHIYHYVIDYSIVPLF